MSAIKFFSFFLLALVMSCGAAKASSSDLDMAVSRALRANGEAYTEATRNNIAKAALEYWRHFDARIPRNTPEDLKWLRGELASKDNDRRFSVMASKQYALQELVDLSDRCVNFFERLTSLDGHSVNYEMFLWMKVASCYGDSDDTVIYLKKVGLSDGGYNDKFSMLHHFGFFNYYSGHLANSFNQ